MSKIENYTIPCPSCKMPSNYNVYHSVNTNFPNAVLKIVKDEINFVKCPLCQNKFQIKTSLLFNNMEKSYAVYYNPKSFDYIESECTELKKVFGNDFYLANPSKHNDWDEFKGEIILKENIMLKL